MMNFLLASDKGKAKKSEKCYFCPYCKKAFDDHHALGGHVGAHQSEIKQRRNQSHVSPSYNSIKGTNSNHGKAFSNPCISKGKAVASSEFANNSYTNETTMLNARDAKNSWFMSPNYSSARNNAASLPPFVQSDRTVPFALPVSQPSYMDSSNFPLGPASNRSSIVDQQSNFGDQQSFMAGFSAPSVDFSPIIQNHSYNKPPYPSFSTNAPSPNYHMNHFPLFESQNVLPGVHINKFPNLKKPGVIVDPSPTSQIQSFGPHGHNDNNNNNRGQVCERVNKRNLCEVRENPVVVSSPKRLKINSVSPEWPGINSIPSVCFERGMLQKKELLLYKDAKLEDIMATLSRDAVARVVPALEIANEVKGKYEVDLDLSLHL